MTRLMTVPLLTILVFLRGSLAPALEPADVPADAPNDAIMASPAEVAEFADWASAVFAGKEPQHAPAGRVWQIGQAVSEPLVAPAGPPFSFVYGGKPSAELLKQWQRTADAKELPERTQYQVAWTDPQSGLRVTAELSVYKRYPAADWVLRFENTGKQDTPILADIQGLDLALKTGQADRPGVLHHLAGDDCTARSFTPLESQLKAGGNIRLAPNGGRSSNGAFPFFNFEYQGRGLFTAIGWSGQWAASFERDAAGPTRLRAGMEKTHLLLHPGEAIRSPRILLMAWQGDLLAAHNRFRRLILFHYTPKQQSRPLAVPVFWQGYDRYNGHPTWPSEAGQIKAAEAAHQSGCDFLWLDAAWFPGNFPNGVGNWTCKPKEFPRGLKPVSEACHKLGMKFIVWFEPERVAPGTQIAREHPEFVFGGAGGGLFKLNDPAALRWLTDLLIARIGEFGMDWYRNDFNIDPLPFWRRNDAPDRQGMTEIRYVEGHYALWDAMLARYPGLCIDNCASGGRRIDLETIRRSIALWRSDTACGSGRGEWHQSQALGMSYYLPLHQICAWTPDAYEMRSCSGAGAIVQFAFLDDGFSMEAARQAVAEAKENQKYFYGDFYPLTRCSTDPDQFLAYQVHRADLGAGLVLAFRRAKCDALGIGVSLGGVKPEADYEVDFIDQGRQKTTRTMSGRALAADFPLMIPQRGASLLVRYREAGNPGAGAAELSVDCGQPAGAIRPLHGVNSGPVNYGGTIDLSAYHRELALPLCRLHDCHWPNPDVVDIHVVFPNFQADPQRPESYDFDRTDDYIRAIVETGSGIVFRLGESIEHTKKKYRVHPPADPEKWAAVCLGIIRHYNEGWAGGFRHKIRYWEIWNEPENRPAMWTGSDEDYFRLYSAASKAIKARFPDVLVGGPAVGNTGRMSGDTLEAPAFLRRFLEHCKRDSAPLDFFSWHVYTNDPQALVRRACAIRRLLDQEGFPKTESHLNEWNYLPGNDWAPMLSADGALRQRWHEQVGGPAGAAFAAASLMLLQDTPLDAANYYAADTQGFGLFNWYGAPKRTFYAFKAFRMLCDTPQRVATQGGTPERLVLCAGTNRARTEVTVLVSNLAAQQERIGLNIKRLPWDGAVAYETLVVDDARQLTTGQSGVATGPDLRITQDLKAPAVCVVRLRKARSSQ